VNKKLVFHNGNTWGFNQGIATGHSWTAIVNSFVNWMIWTSTISNCSVFSDVSEDYSIQIMGDDVLLHLNKKLSDDDIQKVLSWMEENFNYKGVYEGVQADKSLLTSDDRPSFLKRCLDDNGLLDTNRFHLWEKLLMGADASNLRKNRLAYLLRRSSEICTYNDDKIREISEYFSFAELWDRNKFYDKHVLQLLFHATSWFSLGEKGNLKVFLWLCKSNVQEFTSLRDRHEVFLRSFYRRNFQTYSSKVDYVDYWVQTKPKMSVSTFLKTNNKRVYFLNYDPFFKLR